MSNYGREVADDRTRLVDQRQQDGGQSTTSKLLQLAFVSIVVVMVLVTLALSMYRSIVLHNGLYIMTGMSLLGLVVLEIIMILFVRYGHLPREKSWFLYVVGGGILLESIFTNILLFQ